MIAGVITKSDVHFNRAKCIVCESDIKLNAGKSSIIVHFKSSKHRRNLSKVRCASGQEEDGNTSQDQEETYGDMDDYYDPELQEPIIKMEPDLDTSLYFSDSVTLNTKTNFINTRNRIKPAKTTANLNMTETLANGAELHHNSRHSDAEIIDDPSSTTSNSFQNLKLKQAGSMGEMVANEMRGITDPKLLARYKSSILQIVCDLNSGKF